MSHSGSPKIKVVFFDEAIALGGSVAVLARLFRHIDRERFVPKLVTGLDQEPLEQLFEPDDVLCRYRPPLGYVARVRWMRICPARTGRIPRYWARLFTVAATLVNSPAYLGLVLKVAKTRPDLLHANNGRDALFVSGLLRIPLVYHLHGALGQSTRYVRWLRRHTARFISVSRFVSSTAAGRGIALEEIDEIPNPGPTRALQHISSTELRGRFGIPERAFVLAHVGRFLPWKGQLEFLRAFIVLAPLHPGVVALLVGDDLEGFRTPYARSVRRLVDDAGLSDRVLFVGHVSNVLELMSCVDVVVHSSIEPEPFGLVITEAMAAGTVVVASRLGAPAEIIEDGVNGLLVDPMNTQEFADTLTRMIEDPSRRKAVAQAGRQMVRERYSPEEYARRVEAVYERVLSGDRGR